MQAAAPPEKAKNKIPERFLASAKYEDDETPNYYASCASLDRQKKYMAVGTESGYLHICSVDTVSVEVKHQSLRKYIRSTIEGSPHSSFDVTTPNYWISALGWSKDGNALLVSTSRALFCVSVHTNELLFKHTHGYGPAAAIKGCPSQNGRYLVDFSPSSTHAVIGTSSVLVTPEALSPLKYGDESDEPLLSAAFSVTALDEYFTFQVSKNKPTLSEKASVCETGMIRRTRLDGLSMTTVKEAKFDQAYPVGTKGYRNHPLRRGSCLVLNDAGTLLLTNGNGCGLRLYLSSSLTLVGVFGEGLKMASGHVEFTQCAFVDGCDGLQYVAGLPNCWRAENQDVGGGLFAKIQLWVCNSLLFEKDKSDEQLAKLVADLGGHTRENFSTISVAVHSAIGIQEILWTGNTLFGLGCCGTMGYISNSGASDWPGPMYPPGYKVVNNNYFFVEKEDEFDLKSQGGGGTSVVEAGAFHPEAGVVDVVGSEPGEANADDVRVIQTQFEPSVAKELVEAENDRNNSGTYRRRHSSSLGEKTEGGGPDDDDKVLGWFKSFMPAAFDDSSSQNREGSMLEEPTLHGQAIQAVLSRRAMPARGDGGYLKGLPAGSCAACGGRFTIHSCDRKTSKKRTALVAAALLVEPPSVQPGVQPGFQPSVQPGVQPGVQPSVQVLGGGLPQAHQREGGREPEAVLQPQQQSGLAMLSQTLLNLPPPPSAGTRGVPEAHSAVQQSDLVENGSGWKPGLAIKQEESNGAAPLKKRKKGGGEVDFRRGTLLNVSTAGRVGRRVRPRASLDQDRFGFVVAKVLNSSKLVCHWFSASGAEGTLIEEKPGDLLVKSRSSKLATVAGSGPLGDNKNGGETEEQQNFNVPPPLSLRMKQLERLVAIVMTRPFETLKVTIKHLHEGYPGCVFVSRIDEHSPLKNHKVVELGSQLTHVNGVPISNSTQVSTLVQTIASSPNLEKDDRIVWSFSSAKLEEARERVRNGRAEEVRNGEMG